MVAAGCTPTRVQPPPGWSPRPAAEALVDRPAAPGRAWVQLLISYGTITSHNVLRVGPVDATDPPTGVMWDPAGAFGDEYIDWPRREDVLLESPDLATYWSFRRWLGDQHRGMSRTMLILEWEVPAEVAAAMRRPLIEAHGGQGDFDSDIRGGWCGIAMAHFLRAYGGEAFPLGRGYLQGHPMAGDLWAAKPPRRVIVVSRREPTVVYERDADTP